MRTTIFHFVALAAFVAIVLTGIQTTVAMHPAFGSDATSTSEFAAFPVRSPSVSFRDSWGDRRPGGRQHQGTDILSVRGTEVLAIADGTITKMGFGRASGYNLKIDHGNGWVTSYLHLNNDTVGTDDGEGGPWTAFFATLMEGQEVSAGDVVGYVGDSGNAEHTTPHLHFEIKQGDHKVNSYPYLEEVWNRLWRPVEILHGAR